MDPDGVNPDPDGVNPDHDELTRPDGVNLDSDGVNTDGVNPDPNGVNLDPDEVNTDGVNPDPNGVNQDPDEVNSYPDPTLEIQSESRSVKIPPYFFTGKSGLGRFLKFSKYESGSGPKNWITIKNL